MIAKKRSRLFDELILKSWWAVLFFLAVFFAYDQANGHRKREENSLRDKVVMLSQEKNNAFERQEELNLQIASQNDPAWIELTLKRTLGLAPDGATKVLFIIPEGGSPAH